MRFFFLKKLNLFYLNGIFSIFLLTLFSCAKIGSPTGGIKDEYPPKIVESDPENYMVNFSNKKFEITFDEYIQIKNLNKELFVSPPLKEKPVTKIKSKTLVVNINNELLDSTTYTFNFGNAIVDNNEGNPLTNYEFVFSTGNLLDSLSLSGKIINAFDLKIAPEGSFVMLYSTFSDSAPLIEIPHYIGRTDKSGNYRINNIKAGEYKIFALKDDNTNYIYDSQKEDIAFLDSTIILDPQKINLSRDILVDTSYLKNHKGFRNDSIPDYVVDTITGDTVIIPKKFSYTLHADMYMFHEVPKQQFLTSKERIEGEKLLFTFARPLYDSLIIKPINFEYSDGLFLKETSINNDTLAFWITDTTIAYRDTLKLEAGYTVLDTLQNFTQRLDTLTFRYRNPKENERQGRRGRSVQKDTISKPVFTELNINVSNNGKIHPQGNLLIQSKKPVFQFNNNLVHLYSYKDSVEFSDKLNYLPDTNNFRRFVFNASWKEGIQYRLFIEPHAFTDIYGKSNDTIDINFEPQKLEYYGTLLLNLSGIEENTLIQLTDQKENIILQKKVKESGAYKFNFLNPGSYKLKLVFDSNDNDKWDTGNYLKKIQPERVTYYEGKVEVKSNWDIEINWEVGY